jgi:hypothetical protein
MGAAGSTRDIEPSLNDVAPRKSGGEAELDMSGTIVIIASVAKATIPSDHDRDQPQTHHSQ